MTAGTVSLRAMAQVVHLDGRKWPDRLHWQMDIERLGEDEHGVWLYAPGSTIARRGNEPPRELRSGFVACVPEQEWWVVEFYWDHPWHAVYVNIGTPPEWSGDRVTQVDLDLDVVRLVDGGVEVLDEDEFVEHQVQYGYPPELIDEATRAAKRAARMLANGDEPFGSASQRWLEAAGHG